MAKEKESTRALTGSRLLHKNVPQTNWVNTQDPTNGWQAVAGGGCLYYESYFDLSAYELDDLTLVPTAMSLQDGMPYQASGTNAISVFDVISQERLNPADFILYTIEGNFPGSPGSTEDWSQILMCNTRLLGLSTQFADPTLLVPSTAGTFGSASPTAVQKLWIYRVIVPGAGSGDPIIIQVPASRFVLAADIVKEDDLPYMMRLKRSYELATQG